MTNFKIGDRVKVVRKVEKEEGWGDVWAGEMNTVIGQESKILNIADVRYAKGRIDS